MDRKLPVTKSGLSVPEGYQYEDDLLDSIPVVEPPPAVETRTPAPRWYAWVIPARKRDKMWQLGWRGGYESLSELKADQRSSIEYQKHQGATVLALRADLDTVL